MRLISPVAGKVGFARALSRLRTLARLGLAPELIVPEMAIVMARGLRSTLQPAVFVIETDTAQTRPQDFTVWLGADQMVRELRQLLAMGIWPGPKDTPSLHTILTHRENRRVFAATLWGKGCADEGHWADIWRARGIQHGLQAVFFAPSGLIGIAVMARGAGERGFTAAEIAFAETCVPTVAGAIDGVPDSEPYDSPLSEAQLFIDAAGKAGAMSYGVAEMLRDMGEGSNGAVEAMTARIEALAATLDDGPALGLTGDPFIHLRRPQGRAGARDSVRSLQPIAIAQNASGNFAVSFSPFASDQSGQGRIAVINRQVPRAFLAARGAIHVGASARELELAVALTRRFTLDDAAATLGLGSSSAKTLLERLVARTAAINRSDALAALIKAGRSARW